MPHFQDFIQGGCAALRSESHYHFGRSLPIQSGTVAISSFSFVREENQPAEFELVSEVEALGLGGLSNGFRKLVVLFQVFFVPLAMLSNIDGLLGDLALGLLLGHEGHQLFFAPLVVTPLAAGFLELPNQPSADAALLTASNSAHPQTNVINQRRFILASPASLKQQSI